MTLIELIVFVLNLGIGVVTSAWCYASWGLPWGVPAAAVGFVVGFAALPAVVFLLDWLLPRPKQPRCCCGRCGASDYVLARVDVDGSEVRTYRCGRSYLYGPDRKLATIGLDTATPLADGASQSSGERSAGSEVPSPPE